MSSVQVSRGRGDIEVTSVVTTVGGVVIKVNTERDTYTREVLRVRSEAMSVEDHLNGKRWENAN
jgi:hypothetical protein